VWLRICTLGIVNQSSIPTDPDHTDVALQDWTGFGELIDLTVDRLVAPVEGMHRAIAGRWIRLIMPNESPIPDQADRAIAGIYGTIRGAGTLLGTTIPMGARQLAKRRRLKRLWGPGAGRAIQATANAIWGDELASRSSALATTVELRSPNGDRVPVDVASLGRTYPQIGSDLVLLIHGWNETEAAWGRDADSSRPNLMSAVAGPNRTHLLVRYNTGLSVGASGAALAELIDTVTAGWPTAVENIHIVGHSMGGLVARSAVGRAVDLGMDWVGSLRNLVTLGTPHLGSPIEKGLALATRALQIAPESRPIGDFLDLRSRGIKDLRFGGVVNHDWIEHKWVRPPAPPDDNGGLPEAVAQHFATGVITKDPAHPLGVIFGDLVVRPGSGTGQGRNRSVSATNLRVFGGQRHTDILHDPEVHRQVREWLN
jgi:pimeloyl-ACP methyl ester carboxylesterase